MGGGWGWGVPSASFMWSEAGVVVVGKGVRWGGGGPQFPGLVGGCPKSPGWGAVQVPWVSRVCVLGGYPSPLGRCVCWVGVPRVDGCAGWVSKSPGWVGVLGECQSHMGGWMC